MGIFNNKKDKAREGFIKKTPIRNMTDAAVGAAVEKILNSKTGKIGSVTIRGGNKTVKAAINLVKGHKCPHCKKPVTRPMRVHPGNCARQLAYDMASDGIDWNEAPTAMDAQADRHKKWNNITGGMQYDEYGSRIFFDDEGNPL